VAISNRRLIVERHRLVAAGSVDPVVLDLERHRLGMPALLILGDKGEHIVANLPRNQEENFLEDLGPGLDIDDILGLLASVSSTRSALGPFGFVQGVMFLMARRAV
jgi:hypothetical protein